MAKQLEIKYINEIEEHTKKILKMFEEPEPKIVSLLGKERIENFKNIYLRMLDLLKKGLLPFHPNYLGNNELAKSIYEKKYFLKDLNGELIEKGENIFKESERLRKKIEIYEANTGTTLDLVTACLFLALFLIKI